MARPPRKGLNYFPMDVDFFDDEKIVELLITYGPLGCIVYEAVISMVYRQGHYLEMEPGRLAIHVTHRIGNRWVESIGRVEEIIRFCGRIGLFDEQLLQQGVVTSCGIQRRYDKVAVRRRHITREYWLLEDENQEASAAQTGVIAEETADKPEFRTVADGINTANKTKENKTKSKESIVNKTDPEADIADETDEVRNSASECFEKNIRPLTHSELLRLENLCVHYGIGRVKAAILETAGRGIKNLGYIESILRSCYKQPPGSAERVQSITIDARCAELEQLMEEGAYDVAQ